MAERHLVLIDGYSLLFRAFYGTRFLSTSSGRPTNALYGFTQMVFHLLEQHQPAAILVAFDAPGKTFRHAEFEAYKGTRRDTPAELTEQLAFARELIAAFGIPSLEVTGYEADDVIGTVSRLGKEKGYRTLIVTGDLDSLQLVDDHVQVVTTRKGVTDVIVYDPEKVTERYGFGPEFIADYKALVGDTSDNIPGVPGIGDKSASVLIQEFGSVESMLERLDDIPEKFRKKIEPAKEQVPKSKWLATIDREAPVEFDFAPYQLSPEQFERAQEMLTELEFRTLAKRLPKVLSEYVVGDLPREGAASVTREALEPKIGPALEDQAATEKWLDGAEFALAARSEGSLEQQAVLYAHGEAREVPLDIAEAVFFGAPERAMLAEAKPWLRRKTGPHSPVAFDAALAGFVLQSGRSEYGLAELSSSYLDVTAPSELPGQAMAIAELRPVMESRLKDEHQLRVYREMELPLTPILAEMEQLGIAVSADELNAYNEELEREMETREADIYRLAGTDFNLSSSQQVGEILFDRLGLPGGRKTKTKKHSTRQEILEQLAGEYEIARLIIEWRELQKLTGTYLKALPKLIANDGRIHTTLNQMGAATGRLSSRDPNLQNIPIRTDLGRKIRGAFHAASGYDLLAFDYSQIELRILAHMCDDDALVRAFTERDDVHAVTASEMFHVELSSVTKEQRRLAKMLNYAVLYGVSDFGLAQQLGSGFSIAEAKELIQRYNERFPKVKAFTESVVEEAKHRGFTVTLQGRRRYFPDIHAGNRNTRAYAERQAINAPIQGTAADMIKMAMIEVRRALPDAHRMLLQVHDELLFEMKTPKDADLQDIRHRMEHALELDVPVEVDAKRGENWLEMEAVARAD